MSRGQWAALALALIVIGVAGVGAFRAAGGAAVSPPRQPVPEPDLPEHLCQEHEHLAGVVFQPHRYPRMAGQEVTSLLHHGWSSARVRDRRDVQWMISPPSEVSL